MKRERWLGYIKDYVKCLWEVFVWGVWGVVLVVCDDDMLTPTGYPPPNTAADMAHSRCVSVSGVSFSVGVCESDLLIFFVGDNEAGALAGVHQGLRRRHADGVRDRHDG